MAFGDVLSRDPLAADARLPYRIAFLSEVLAFAAGELREEIVETAITLVLPTKLNVGPLEQAHRPHCPPLAFSGKSNVQ